MLSKIQIASLIMKAYEINAANRRYKLCVDYSKCLGDHHVNFYVIDEAVPYDETGSRVVVSMTLCDKYGDCTVEGALAEMDHWRESA